MEKGELDPPGVQKKAGIRPEILLKMADVPLRRENIVISAPQAPSVAVQGDGGHTMELSRAGLTRIVFLAPEDTPSASTVARDLPDGVRRRCVAALDLSPAALAEAMAALAGETRGIPPKVRRSVAAMIAANAPSDGDVHDIFFNVTRASKPKPAFYLRSILETLIAFRQDLAESPVTVDAATLCTIETGLLTILGAALGEAPRRSRGVFLIASVPAFEDYAARRWIRGHQIFAALSQGLIAALGKLDAASGGGPSQRDAVAEVVIGLEACAAALKFTGDFAEPIYDAQIRPSMCPPHTPRGFSGLLSADHSRLVRNMKEMKPAMEALQARHPDGHRAIAAALSQVYDSHKHVCSKFVGTERSSLLMMNDATRSSVEQLERFKTMRIRSLG